MSSLKSCSGRRRKIVKRPQNKDWIAHWSLFTSCSGRYRNHQTHAMCSFPPAPAVLFLVGSTSTAGAYLIYVMGCFLGCKARINKGCFEEGFGTRGRDGCLQKEEEEKRRRERGEGLTRREGVRRRPTKKKLVFSFKCVGSKGGREVSKKKRGRRLFPTTKRRRESSQKKKGFQKVEGLSRGGG